MSDQPLEIHPDCRVLLDEISLLREELAQLLTEEHDLLHIIKPNLLALYQKKIGRWELECLRAQVRASRTRRKLELAQAALNQGHAPDWAQIEGMLELEFLAWQQKVKEAAQQITDAEARLQNLLSPAANREIKKLYHALVKKLHPDLNPEPDEGRKRLWLRVQAAYEGSDMDELCALNLLAEKSSTATPGATGLEELRRQRDIFERQTAEMLRRIGKVESQPPFTMRAQLADEAWVSAQTREIHTRIAEHDRLWAALDARLQVMINHHGHGQIFGSN